jgi:peptide/nickel transport system permease protein
MLQHILLNSLSPLVVQAALGMGFSVLIEASLSFLGLGIEPPEPSLGSILDASRSKMRHAYWYPLFPGAILTMLLFALNGAADVLNDVLNPRPH